jgi:hypothetical protein
MPILGIDHLVIAVRDPDAAAADLERELRLAFTGGGRHAAAGTWNRLAFLDDAYLELIGVEDRGRVLANPEFAVGSAALAVLDAGSEGLATWAVAVHDCAAEVSRLHRGGSPIGDPMRGSRVRPDGETVRWVTAFPALGPAEPPFLIEHEMAGAEWGPAAMAERRAFEHPGLGRARLGALVLPVPDPANTAARFEAVVGIRFDAGASGWAAQVGPHAVSLLTAAANLGPIVRLQTPVHGAARRSLVCYGVGWDIRPAA